ncbi:hypothetical protein [Algihabitans albus]|uniref:hypothetical protein n=1 Tax=Algihabitans albus TaxID=2164067 RepID=UPI000E5D0077|nr:hypothetical protein [Algihabitans albus]
MFIRACVLSSLVAAVLPLPAVASTDCAGIPDDAARLACYDSVYRAPGQETPRWALSETISALDDRREVEMVLDAVAPFEDRFGELVRASLHLACRGEEMQVWVHFGGAYFSEHAGGATMIYRLGDGAARRRDFAVANDRRSLGFWTGRAAGLFLGELEGQDRLTVQATPFRTNRATAVFDLAGFPAALRKLRAACRG